MQEYQFQIFSPGGNDTALVFGLDYDKATRRKIDHDIRRNYEVVEQVGLVGKTDGSHHLDMAGGEFCGNATRCAAWYFLNNTIGDLDINVSGVAEPLKAGVKQADTAWTTMPVGSDLDSVSVTEDDFYLVTLEGIVHLVIPSDKSEQFLSVAHSANSFCNELKEIAKGLMDKHSLTKHPACGVMFLEDTEDGLLMHPCVLVTGVESSMYYETACGSGSIATAMVSAYMNKDSVSMSIIQPSKHTIIAAIEVTGGKIRGAYIDGAVITDGKIIARMLPA